MNVGMIIVNILKEFLENINPEKFI